MTNTKLIVREQPVISYNASDKFKTALFLPPVSERTAEGGLRTLGYFKHSYKKVEGQWFLCDTENSPLRPAPFRIKEHIEVYLEKCRSDCASGTHIRNVCELPLITVVTVTKNCEKSIEKTILSVLSQSYPNVEYLVIDGNSTDGTSRIIRTYEKQIDYWVSEPDNSIYEAMNKGILLSTGQWILFINAGDFLCSEHTVSQIWLQTYGNLKEIFDDVALIYGKWLTKFGNEEYEFEPLPISELDSRMFVAHGSSLFRSRYIKQHGYDTSYRIGADFELYHWLRKQGLRFMYVPISILWVDFEKGESKTKTLLALRERMRIVKSYSKPAAATLFFKFFLIELGIAIGGKVLRSKCVPPLLRQFVRRIRFRKSKRSLKSPPKSIFAQEGHSG